MVCFLLRIWTAQESMYLNFNGMQTSGIYIKIPLSLVIYLWNDTYGIVWTGFTKGSKAMLLTKHLMMNTTWYPRQYLEGRFYYHKFQNIKYHHCLNVQNFYWIAYTFQVRMELRGKSGTHLYYVNFRLSLL